MEILESRTFDERYRNKFPSNSEERSGPEPEGINVVEAQRERLLKCGKGGPHKRDGIESLGKSYRLCKCLKLDKYRKGVNWLRGCGPTDTTARTCTFAFTLRFGKIWWVRAKL